MNCFFVFTLVWLHQVGVGEQALDQPVTNSWICDWVNDSAPKRSFILSMTTWSATYFGSFRGTGAGGADALQLAVAGQRDVDGDGLGVLDPDQDHVGEVDLGGPGGVGDDLLQEAQEDRQHLHVRVAVVDDLGHEVVEPDVGGDVLAEQVEGVEGDLVVGLERGGVAAARSRAWPG